MHLVSKRILVVIAALVLTMPVWARTLKGEWSPTTSFTMGTTHVTAGAYQFMADDSKPELTLMQKGKVFATVKGQWVKLPKKADSTSVSTDGNKVSQVQFGGSDQAFQPE